MVAKARPVFAPNGSTTTVPARMSDLVRRSELLSMYARPYRRGIPIVLRDLGAHRVAALATAEWRGARGDLARVRARRPHAAEADAEVAHDGYARETVLIRAVPLPGDRAHGHAVRTH